jgi:hypothetical protein
MLRQTMIALITAALASGFFAADAQARGGGGGMHMGGGHMGGMHRGGMHMGGGHSNGIRFSGGGRGFHRGPRFGGYGDWSANCSPLGWQRSWPDGCF